MKSKQIFSEERRQKLIDKLIDFGDGSTEFETKDINDLFNALVSAEQEIIITPQQRAMIDFKDVVENKNIRKFVDNEGNVFIK